MSNSDEYREWMLAERAVDVPCVNCCGSGVRAYASTSTWRGGVGGSTICSDVCDRCWGTGDDSRRGISYRTIEMWKAAYDREQMKK